MLSSSTIYVQKKVRSMEEELNCAPLRRSNPKWKRGGKESPKEKTKAKK
jgi:hypothetical protein